MPCSVTHVLLIAVVDNTVIKLRCFSQAYTSSQSVFVEINNFFKLLNVKPLSFFTIK